MIDRVVLESFRNRNVVVTGGTGMIGRNIAEILCDVGALVDGDLHGPFLGICE